MTPILLLALLFAAQSVPQSKPPEKGTISGSVANAVTAEPLGKAEVQAHRSGRSDSAFAFTTTDAKGNYSLVDLEPGSYQLVVRRNGYLDSPYGSRHAGKSGTPVALEAGQELKGIQIKALPFGVIAGTVREADGEPVANANVTLYQWSFENGRRWITGVGSVTTDDLGQYRMIGLAPGKYYLCARPDSSRSDRAVDHSRKTAQRPEALIQTFYPSATDPAAASLVEVSAGARVTGIDIVLARSPLFHVQVQLETPSGLAGNVQLNYSIAGFDDIGHTMKTKQGFDIGGVPRGSWILTATAGDERKSTPGMVTFEFAKRTYETHVPVQIAGADVEGLRVVVNTGAEITGHVTVKGEKPPLVAERWITFDDGGRNSNNSMIDQENVFRNRLSAGHYVVALSNVTERNELYVESMHSDGRDILREGLTVAGPGKIAIEILLSPDGGQVAGVALDKDEKPVSGATVVLVPGTGLPDRHDFYKEFTTDQYGRIEFKGVAPGEYRIYAWEDVESGAWFDPAFLRDSGAKGEAVTVEARGHHTVKVKVIPAAN